MDELIRVRDNIVRAALMMGARQIVLLLGGFLFNRFVLSGDLVEAIATGIVVLGTFAYGQLKGWRDKRKAIKLAKSAPIGVVMK